MLTIRPGEDSPAAQAGSSVLCQAMAIGITLHGRVRSVDIAGAFLCCNLLPQMLGQEGHRIRRLVQEQELRELLITGSVHCTATLATTRVTPPNASPQIFAAHSFLGNTVALP